MTILILAAGAGRRMGRQKLLLPLAGRPMIMHVITAAAAWPLVIVTSDEVAQALDPTALRIIRNGLPERGMSYSFALGNAAVPEAEPIAVLLGDLPDITHTAIARAIEAYDDSIDVVVPRCGRIDAHPVVFGPRARRKINTLPDGDTIRRLRDDPSLRRRVVETDPGALTDIDTPADYTQWTGQRAHALKSSP